MKRQLPVKFETPAKINPFLWVLEKRADGYHEVRLGYVAISLYDRLSLESREEAGLELVVRGLESPPPQQENLVYRAAMAFAGAAGVSLSLRITLEKHIPSSAGLGGGSGNAAGVLMALNHLFGEPLTPQTLAALAAGLGSDVPFFLSCQPSIGFGRGEQLSPLSGFPMLHLVVVMPPVRVSTAEAYGLTSPRGKPPPDPAMETAEAVLAALENDFGAAVAARYPQIEEARARLIAAGAQGALLSGSGAAVFGVFPGERQQLKAVERLGDVPGWQVFPCKTLAHHRYLG